MPNSLSRIEREYVLKNLEESRPSLTLQQGTRFVMVDNRSWRMISGLLEFRLDLHSFSDGLPFRVHFRHKDRALFFDSAISADGSGLFSMNIPADILKVDGEERSVGMKLIVLSFEPALELRESPSFPLDVVFIDPVACAGREAVFGRLVSKLGLEAASFGDSALAFRLYEYVDGFRAVEALSRISPTLVYVDSAFALVALPKIAYGRLKKNETIRLSLLADSRRIDCSSEIRGMMPLNAEYGLLLLDFSLTQPEDKRFLHERLFRNKYQGT